MIPWEKQNITIVDKLQIRSLIIGVALVPISALSIYFVYGPDIFAQFPWLRSSLLLALLTCLWTYTFSLFHVITGKDSERGYTFPFVFIVMPFSVLLVHPETIGSSIGSKFVTLLFVLDLFHGIGFYLIQRGIKKIFSWFQQE